MNESGTRAARGDRQCRGRNRGNRARGGDLFVLGAMASRLLPPFWQLVALLATHWVGDFALQTNFQASNKSKRLDALSLHVATYTVTLFVAAIILFGVRAAVIFAAINCKTL